MVMMAAAALVIVVVLVVLVMVVLMVVAAAALVLLVVLIVVVVMMLVLMPIVILVIVVMAAAGAVAVFIEMMMVLVLFVLVVVMMVMLVMLVLILVLFVLALNAFKRGGERVALFHRVEDLRAGELVPRRRDDDGAGILLAQQRDALGELFLLDARGAGEDDAPGGFDLVVEKFAEVAHIHFAFARVYDGAERVDRKLAVRRLLHGGHDVGELADARGLDEDAVGGVALADLVQSGAEITRKAAADAAGVHLRHLNAGVLHEAAVHADLAELVLDEDELFARVGFRDQLFDERGLARAEETGKYINFCHTYNLFLLEAACFSNRIL